MWGTRGVALVSRVCTPYGVHHSDWQSTCIAQFLSYDPDMKYALIIFRE